MKRTISLIFVIFLGMSLLAADPADALRKTPAEYFKYKDVIKVYIDGIINSSGDSKIDVKDLKGNIEKAFLSRTKYNFDIVKDKRGADIIVTVDVEGFFWTDHDPIDIPSLYGAVADAVIQENYARMDALITVNETKRNRRLWQQKVIATITSSTMTEKESYDMISARIADMFMKELLKTKKRGITI